MYALRAEVDKMYEAGAQDKPVAWVMLGQWAEPILTAMDVISIYPENYGSVCAAAGKAGPFLDISDAEGFPTHLCSYARNCYGYSAKMRDLGGVVPPDAPMGGMPGPNLLVASSEICDARFKWFQSLGRYFDAPVWTVETPYPGLKESLEEGADERNTRFIVKAKRIRRFSGTASGQTHGLG
jgi:benzoyl-CoA reductase/2-hydroxyglutaryl-CoA dehydratase subunit BcrC/BadD/HgdB